MRSLKYNNSPAPLSLSKYHSTLEFTNDHALDRAARLSARPDVDGRTGGEAEYFARAGSSAQLKELLGWAKTIDAQVHVVGSGSNLLIADEGVRGLVVKLDRKLALIKHEGRADRLRRRRAAAVGRGACGAGGAERGSSSA